MAQAVELEPALLQEIRKLHFQTRRLADQGITGSYRSAFRGTGIEFEEVREYTPGDDIRAIDWKVTARSGKPYIKSYREERELTVMIAVDVSSSTFTGTRNQLREALIAKIGAVLTFIALINNDKVGLVTFSDQLETYHPARKARGAVWRILHEVMSPGNYHPGTDLAGMCSFLSNVLKRKAIIFILSDFIAPPFEKELAVLAKRHDVTAIRVSDPADAKLPGDSLVQMRNPESGELTLIDTADSKVKEHYEKAAKSFNDQLHKIFQRHSIGTLELQTNQPFIHDLRKFFDKRHNRAHAKIRS